MTIMRKHPRHPNRILLLVQQPDPELLSSPFIFWSRKPFISSYIILTALLSYYIILIEDLSFAILYHIN